MSDFEIKDIQYQITMSKNRQMYRYRSYRLCRLLANVITLASSQHNLYNIYLSLCVQR